MSELIRKLKLVDEWLDRDEYRPTSTIRTTVAEITDEAQRLLQQAPCSALRDFVAQMHSHVMVMKSRAGLSDSDERYIGGQELICSLVLQEIDKLSPVA